MIKYAISIILTGISMLMNLHASEHVPWKLDGAQERIEKIRMGDCTMQLVLPNGISVPGNTQYTLNQMRHAFNFGGSLAADWKVPNQNWYPDFKARFANLFNYATIDFYWSVHEKQRGEWNYDLNSRNKLDWAKSQGMKLRGHPLMWHEVVPEWIESTDRPLALLNKDIIDHVRMLVETYPEIDEWDLYNETPGIRLKDENMGARRWVEWKGGPGPVTEALVDAVREVDPGKRYILNHFTDNDPEYNQQIEYCLSKDVPVGAVGIQTHMHYEADSYSEERLWKALEDYSKYNKPLHLSEITVLSCEMFPGWEELLEWTNKIDAAEQDNLPPPNKPSTAEWEKYQADLTHDFYTLAFSHPAVETIVWWTITDLEPWRGMPAGLLDAEGHPKPVYRVLDELINEKWKTNIRATTDSKGRVSFRGFYGTYKVTAEYGGQSLVGTFDLLEGQTGIKKVVLESCRQQ